MTTATLPRPALPQRALRIAQDNLTMLDRNIRHTLRSPDTMIMTLALPIMILLMFVYVFGGAMNVGGGAYIDYVVPGIILLCAGFGASTTAVSISTDVADGIVDRFRTMSIARSAMLTGHVIESVIRNMITTGLVVVVAVALGFRPTADPVRWLGATALIALFVFALSWLAAALGLLARNPEAANGFTFVFMFLPYVSSAFVPTESMPTALHAFAENQPVTPVIETVRGLLMGTQIGGSAALAVAWCGGVAALGYLAARVLFRRRTAN
ncbi:Daunorubicin/doxorubicin resistance ABC transporter permease protein DrrB [Nocardia farcinica]|uniref:ABC transporter permease n=1 Tax=Nocardia farcinica TaxID=37329 RepID=UPI000BF386EA|nr:ABC transporter permease [Nocardia farcinica]PFX00285.1 Daunorubicin/doxorubicin resistance ABC transporter permease protein DrrB [Nocardia farcinica]PFX07843.1 Daunorubicin/doxorubicin resistance ABC transporter permease protein DrrB [Nocardia farcinica]